MKAFKAMLATAGAGLLLALPVPVLAGKRFVMYTTKSIVTARIDPIVSPGQVSQHSHHVAGASSFSPTYDPVKQREAKCTNFAPQADMSNYWQPQVLRVLSNGSYLAMPTNTRIYYEVHTDNYPANVTVEPFPYDFQYLAGSPSRKTFDGFSQSDLSQFYYCETIRPDGSTTGYTSNALPTTPCSILVAKVFMPNCWNGNSYDPEDPHAHVVYSNFGDGYNGKYCPDTHQRRLPSILIETYYFNANYPATNPKQIQYILANGDTTGYGLHADFQNGWDMEVLQAVIDQCGTTPFDEPADQACPALNLKGNFNQQTANECFFEGKIPDEPVGFQTPITTLPGCNLRWGKEAEKPRCNPKLGKGIDPPFVFPAPGTIWN